MGEVVGNSYSYDLILNIGGESWQSKALEQRIQGSANYNGHEIHSINVRQIRDPSSLSENERRLFQKVDGHSRIYMIDHGYRMGKTDTLDHVHFSDYGKFLGTHMPSKQLEGPGTLKVSLILCNSAGGDAVDAKESFAGRLHANLGNLHGLKNVEVLGRKGVTWLSSRAPELGKLTSRWNDYAGINSSSKRHGYDLSSDSRLIHKGPGWKLAYVWNDKGQQLIVDAYALRAIRDAKALADELRETLEPGQLAKIMQYLDAIAVHAATPLEQLDRTVVAKAVGTLWLLQQSLGKALPEPARARISALAESFALTTSDKSHNPEPSGRVATSKAAKTPNKIVEEELFGPAQEPLRQMPKTDKERAFKRIYQREILVPIGTQAREKLTEGTDITAEREIVRFLSKLADTVRRNESNAVAEETVEQICDILKSKLVDGGYDSEIVTAVDKLRKEAVSYVKDSSKNADG